MINNVTLVGRIGKELELKYTPSGAANLTFSLAVNRSFTNQQGEKETDWINVVVWRKQAENTANYCDKGSMIGITGRIQTRSYEGQDGKKIYITEVVAENVTFLDSKRDNSQSNTNTGGSDWNSGNHKDNSQWADTAGKNIDIEEDDLPF